MARVLAAVDDLNPADQEGPMKSFFRRLGWLAQRSRKEAELREELQFHLEEEAEQASREGCRRTSPMGGAA